MLVWLSTSIVIKPAASYFFTSTADPFTFHCYTYLHLYMLSHKQAYWILFENLIVRKLHFCHRVFFTFILECLILIRKQCGLAACAVFWNRNEDKTQQKINDIQKDIVENQKKSEKLQDDLKQMDVDARKVLDEHKQAMVLICHYCRICFMPLLF